MNVPSLAPQCPWYGLSELAKPNVKWCEASMCGWVTEPANTWSNMAYLFLAILMYKYVKDNKLNGSNGFIAATLFTGASSFIYHASYTAFFQFFDFLAMIIFLALPLTLNAVRAGIIEKNNAKTFGITLTIIGSILTVVFYFTHIPMQGLILFMVLALIGTEFAANKRKPREIQYKNFFVGLGLIATAATFSVLDVTRTMCNPHNHFVQGHALWHCFSAGSLYFAFKFYMQFQGQDFSSANEIVEQTA